MLFAVPGTCLWLLATLMAAAAGAQSVPDRFRIEREIVLRGGASHSLAWSPDGKWIASGGDCGDVLVVDAETGRVVHELFASDHWIGALLFSPDSRALFVGGRELTRWDLASGKRTAHTAHASPSPAALSRDGNTIACVRENTVVELRTAADLQLQRSFAVPDETAIDAIAFDRAAARLAVGKRSGNTYVLAIDTGEIIETLTQPGWVRALAFRDDNGLVRMADAELLGFTNRPEVLDKSAWGMAIDPAARLCVIWNSDNVRGFTRDGTAFAVPGSGAAAIHCDGATWVRARGSKLELHRGNELMRTLPLAHRARPGATVLVGDGQHIAIARADGTHVFDVATGTAVTFPDGAPRGEPVQYPGGTELAMWQGPRLPSFWAAAPGAKDATTDADDVGRLSFWSLGAQRQPALVREHRFAHILEFPEGATPQFSSDGRFLAVGGTMRDAVRPEEVLWRVPDALLDTLRPLPGGRSAWGETRRGGWRGMLQVQSLSADGKHGPVREFWGRYAIDWSADGSRLLMGARDGLCVFDTKSDAQTTFLPHPNAGGAWLDNNTLLLVHDGRLELVTVPKGTVIASLELPSNHARISVAADGKRAAVVTHDRVLIVHVGRE
jgi:WD40 repeat protein